MQKKKRSISKSSNIKNQIHQITRVLSKSEEIRTCSYERVTFRNISRWKFEKETEKINHHDRILFERENGGEGHASKTPSA